MADRVLDQRLHRHRRDDRVSGLRWNVDADAQAAAKAGLLEPQIALDVRDLLAEGHVWASVAEQVARELGEVDQQLPRLLGASVDVAGHGSQGVVDEVRRDLRAQRSQLGLSQRAPAAR